MKRNKTIIGTVFSLALIIISLLPLVPVLSIEPLPGGPEQRDTVVVSTQQMLVGIFKHVLREGDCNNLQWWRGSVYYFPQWYSWLISFILLVGASIGGFSLGVYTANRTRKS